MFDDDELIEVVLEVIDDLKTNGEQKITIHVNDMEQIINIIKKLKLEII